jgi:hypothetical protein
MSTSGRCEILRIHDEIRKRIGGLGQED